MNPSEIEMICKLFEIPQEGENLLPFFFSEEEIRFLLSVGTGEIQLPIPSDFDGIDTASEYHRGLLVL